MTMMMVIKQYKTIFTNDLSKNYKTLFYTNCNIEAPNTYGIYLCYVFDAKLWFTPCSFEI